MEIVTLKKLSAKKKRKKLYVPKRELEKKKKKKDQNGLVAGVKRTPVTGAET